MKNEQNHIKYTKSNKKQKSAKWTKNKMYPPKFHNELKC